MNGLLVCPLLPGNKIKNIGDYIQSLAQEQFWNKIDCYVEREKMSEFVSDENVNLIMNGWFLWSADKFPPSDCINPLFISFHLTPSRIDKVLSNPKSVEYLKRYQPIGCRDIDTKEKLEQYGINAYFSGCLTTTLGYKGFHATKNGNILFIEPFNQIGMNYKSNLMVRTLQAFTFLFKHWNKVSILKDKVIFEKKTHISRISKKLDILLNTATFYHVYSKIFSDEVLLNAIFMSQLIEDKNYTEEDKLEIARDYLRKYAEAELVVTSRLHAAFPSMALGTKTIYIDSDAFYDDTYRPAGRLKGNIELLNHYTWTTNGLKIDPNSRIKHNGVKISTSTQIELPEAFLQIRNSLISKVESFVARINND